jgi:hypothetical protein
LIRYIVTWLPVALDELALIWVNALDRQAVADAADRIDLALRVDPDQKGRQRQGYWLYADLPLLVAYEIIPDDCMVRIVRVIHI